jgi:hypothetical protein
VILYQIGTEDLLTGLAAGNPSWKKHNYFETSFWGRMTPKNVQNLVPGTWEYVILHNKRDFTDVTRLLDLELGTYPVSSE